MFPGVCRKEHDESGRIDSAIHSVADHMHINDMQTVACMHVTQH